MGDIFAIYKEKGPTSNDIIMQLKKITDTKKVGHAGTLDPLASGVLVVGVGREATKKLGDAMEKEKEYIAKIKLGETSSTDDEEGDKTSVQVSNKPNEQEVKEVIESFIGSIKQMPPVFSSVKVSGKPAHRLVRSGKRPKLGERDVELKEAEIIKYSWPYLELRLVTGSGFYVRSLARDIGEKLKTGGYLAGLERTRVGDFTKDEAITIEEFSKIYISDTK